MKNIRHFLSENFHFFVVKFSAYLNRRVFVMNTLLNKIYNYYYYQYYYYYYHYGSLLLLLFLLLAPLYDNQINLQISVMFFFFFFFFFFLSGWL